MGLKRTSKQGPLFVKGSTINDLTRRIETLEGRPKKTSRLNSTHRDVAMVLVQNNTGSLIESGSLVGIGPSVVIPGQFDEDYAYVDQFLFEAESTDETSVSFGIAIRSIPDGEMSSVAVTGSVNGIVNVTDLSHFYAKPSDTDGILISTEETTGVLILYSHAVGTSELCKVMIGGGGSISVWYATMDEDIQPGETKQATKEIDSSKVQLTYDAWLSDEQISSGKNVAYISTVNGEPDVIMWSECEDPPTVQTGG